jgi:hypothetical protein
MDRLFRGVSDAVPKRLLMELIHAIHGPTCGVVRRAGVERHRRIIVDQRE